MFTTADRNYVFVSDLHLSEGFLESSKQYHKNEDFFYDDAFARFLAYLEETKKEKRYKKPWRLVINGDFIDFLQVTTSPDPGDQKAMADFKKAVTEATGKEYSDGDLAIRKKEFRLGLSFDAPKSVWKLARVVDGHPRFFSGLAEFLVAGNELVIIKGNHDAEFTYPEVREHFRRILDKKVPDGKPSKNVFFSRWFYYEKGLFYAEHGGQYDDANRYVFFLDPTMVRKPPDPRLPTLRFPFGSFFVRYVFNRIEEETPFADNIRPQMKAVAWILTHRPWFAVFQSYKAIQWFMKIVKIRIFEGFNRLAFLYRLKTRSSIFSLLMYYLLFPAIMLFAGKSRVEFEKYRTRNFMAMFESEGYGGLIPEGNAPQTDSDIPIIKLTKIYLRRFGKKAFKEDTNETISAKLDTLLPRETRTPAVEIKGDRKRVISTIYNDLRTAAEPTPFTESCVFKKWRLGAWLAVLVFATVAVVLFTRHDVGGGLIAAAGVVAAYVLRGFGAEVLRSEARNEPENYLNRSAKGVAKILGEGTPYVIFGHTHVAYVNPIENEKKLRPVKQWEVNTGSWTPVFDEKMMLRRTGDEFPFVQLTTEVEGAPELKLLHWNDELGQPQTIRYTGGH